MWPQSIVLTDQKNKQNSRNQEVKRWDAEEQEEQQEQVQGEAPEEERSGPEDGVCAGRGAAGEEGAGASW